MTIILSGIEFLKEIDSTMFQRLTVERRYTFWYYPSRMLQCYDIFNITDNFLCWGKEGVAICFVQCIFELTLGYPRRTKNMKANHEVSLAIRRDIQQQILSWMVEHAFPAELLKQYEEIERESREAK